MSKKIILTEEEVKECLRLYNDELLGCTTISKIMGFHDSIILRTLKENNITPGPPGRRNIGGKSVADKKYSSKPEIKIKLKKYRQEYRKTKKEELSKYLKEWYIKNKDHVNEHKRNYERNRRANDPKYRLTARTRTAVYTCLKEANISKYRSTFELLGYSIEDLMKHLEALFIDDMNWENYGKWHVDHIKPISSFNFENSCDSEFKKCWSLSNLRPLWAKDNLSKGKKYEIK